jgi:hypothetical protein
MSIKDKKQGEVAAVIGMALHEISQEVHDVEHGKLTFGTLGRIYSPWSSKIYGLNQLPYRR